MKLRLFIFSIFNFYLLQLFSQVGAIKNLECTVIGGISSSQTSYKIDNIIQEDSNACGDIPAIHVVIIDTIDCAPWGTYFNGNNNLHQFGNINNDGNCRNRVEKYFIFQPIDPIQMDSLKYMLNYRIPEGNYILIYSWKYLTFSYWQPSLLNTFNNLGASNIYPIYFNYDSIPYIFFVQYGNPSSAIEVWGQTKYDTINLNTTISCDTSTNQIEFLNSQTQISISPNPFTDKFKINNPNNITSITIYNVFGQQIFQSANSNLQSVIDLSSYPNGIYFLTSSINSQIQTYKLIKM